MFPFIGGFSRRALKNEEVWVLVTVKRKAKLHELNYVKVLCEFVLKIYAVSLVKRRKTNILHMKWKLTEQIRREAALCMRVKCARRCKLEVCAKSIQLISKY